MKDIMAGKDAKVYVRLSWQWYTHRGTIATWEDGGYYNTSSDNNKGTEISDENGNNVTIQ